jgi:pilus assembly protein Flp/PilA
MPIVVDSDSRVVPYVTGALATITAMNQARRAMMLAEGGETFMLNGLMSLVQSLVARVSLRDENGQALVEYGLLVGLIAVVCITAITLLGTQIEGFFNTITGAL